MSAETSAMLQDSLLAEAIDQLETRHEIEVLWLYGSRATGLHDETSDIDLATALAPLRKTDLTNRIGLLDDLAYALSQALPAPVSLIDINRAPVPLAYNVITHGRVLMCRSDLRLRAEEQRIWSLWAEYKREHERFRTAL